MTPKNCNKDKQVKNLKILRTNLLKLSTKLFPKPRITKKIKIGFKQAAKLETMLYKVAVPLNKSALNKEKTNINEIKINHFEIFLRLNTEYKVAYGIISDFKRENVMEGKNKNIRKNVIT